MMIRKTPVALLALLTSAQLVLAQSSSLSNLSAGSAVNGSDLFYDVQTPGTGGVKVTATQISTYLWGLVGGDCTASAGNFTCTKTGGVSLGTFATQSAPTGLTQCLHANSSGVVSGTGSDCGAGGGAVSSVSNSDSTLTISPTTGAVVASLNLAHANTWTGVQTITNSDLKLLGSSTGATTFTSANAGASNFTLTVPAATDQLVARATTDTLTNKTYDSAGTGNVFKINGTQVTAISGNTGTVGTTSGALTSGDCLKADVSGNIVTTGSACGAGGGGTPGGSSTDVQFNSAGSFGGDSGFTYAGSGQATLALGTITTNLKALSITGTWNNAATTFDAPLFMNITNTASASGSLLVDFQVGGSSVASIDKTGAISFNGTPGVTTLNSFGLSLGNSMTVNFGGTITLKKDGSSGDTYLTNTVGIVHLVAGADIVSVDNSTTGQAFRVYNTIDVSAGTPTNYERGVFDWTTTANVLTIGTQAGGTGTGRGVALFSAATAGNALTISTAGSNIVFGGGSTGGITFNSNGNFNSTTLAFSGSGSISRGGPNVLAIGSAGGVGDTSGFINWGGEARTTAATTYTSNTTLSTILTANVQAGRTYSFEVYIPVTASLSTGGIKVALAGTATVTSMIADGKINSGNTQVGQAQVSSLTTVVSAVGGAATGFVEIHGTITVNAAGTFLVQTAQNTSSATSTVVGQGARLIMNDMP